MVPASTPPPRRKSRKWLARLLFVAFGLVWVFWGVDGIAYLLASRPLAPAIEIVDPTKCSHLVVVARRAERRLESESNVPLRNSLLGVYTKAGPRWVKRSRDFACRSRATSGEFPLPTDVETVVKFAARHEQVYRYGHVSVPEGFYRLHFATLRSKPAFLISDWNSVEGTIGLSEPQTLRACRVEESDNGGPRCIDLPSTYTVVSHRKGMCFLHSSPTRQWSHADSMGCINLFGPDRLREGETSDWELFHSVIRKQVSESETPILGLLVVPAAALHCEEDGSLPDSIGIEIVSNHGKPVAEIVSVGEK